MGTAVDIMRLWARARSVMPSWDRPRSRMACFTRAVIPATWGAAMEVPDIFSYWSLPPCTPPAVMCRPLTE